MVQGCDVLPLSLFYLWTPAAAKRHGRPVIMYGQRHRPHLQSKAQPRADDKVMNRYVDAITLQDPRLHEGTGGSGGHCQNCSLSADTIVSLPLPP